MKKANYIVFDCETGGLDCEKNPILEIALVTLDTNLKEIKRYETYVKPYDDLVVEQAALNANGIKMKDVHAKGITKKELQDNIAKYFKSSMPSTHPSMRPVIVGHNIPFDIGFMDRLFRGTKTPFSNLRADVFIDTMGGAKQSWPDATSISLGNCCERAGISLINAHRAMPDVLATADLFRYFTYRLQNSTGGVIQKKAKIEEKSRTQFQF